MIRSGGRLASGPFTVRRTMPLRRGRGTIVHGKGGGENMEFDDMDTMKPVEMK